MPPKKTLEKTALLALALTLAVALAACGGSSPSGAPAAEGRADPSAFPVTVRHQFGTTEVPEVPERVVTVGYTEGDTVLALGVKPVGEREFLGGYDYRSRPWAQDELDGYQPVAVGGEQINFEQVAKLAPDLIVGIYSGMTRADYERLSEIAPTIAQSDEYIEFGTPWQAQTRTIGRALGRERQAERLVREVEADFSRARKAHREFDGATFALTYTGDAFGAYASGDARTLFFRELGFRTPPEIDDLAGDSFYVDLDEERFRLVDQDVIVNFGRPGDVTGSPVLSRLRAARQDRIIHLDLSDDFAGALGYSSPLSLPFLLRQAVPRLAAAVDGDPATPVRQPD